jgi:hypothetical protein
MPKKIKKHTSRHQIKIDREIEIISDNDLEKKIINLNDKIKDYIYDKEILPVYDINDLSDNLEYDQVDLTTHTNCHIGQRKLLLNKLEFINKFIKDINSDNNLIIYTGSAPFESSNFLFNMYPKLKFLLIDASYHLINNFKYIYQNLDNIDKGNYNYYINFLKDQSNNQRSIHLKKIVEKYTKAKFLYESKEINVYNIHDQKYQTEMKKLHNQFKNDSNIIDLIMKDSQTNAFIIQDYLTINLINIIKSKLDSAKNKPNIYYISDLRTFLYDKVPLDIDIMENSALQAIFIKLIRPIYSMLKFRTLFFNNNYITENIINDKTDKYNQDRQAIDYLKKNYNIDMIKSYYNKKLLYFDSEYVVTQPWAPHSSSESRMLVSLKSIDKSFIEWDSTKYENQFYFLKNIRLFKFYQNFVFNLIENDINKELHYDGCYDCSREIMILADCIDKHSNDKYDIQKISHNLKRPEVTKEIIKLYKLINKYIFFDLSKSNLKCKHLMIIEQPKYLTFERNDKIFKIDKYNQIKN